MTVISDVLLPVLGQALADAISYRTPRGFCPGCDEAIDGWCAGHVVNQAMADGYRGVALVLGIRLGT